MRPSAIDENMPMRLALPTRVHAHIAPYVRGRRSTASFTELDQQTRADTGCRTNCPPSHTCYPTGGDGCVIGEKRPGRDHCCELDIDNTDKAFLASVTHMHQFAGSDDTNRGTASEEYRADLGRIIPTDLSSQMHSVFHEPNEIDFFFRFKESHNISESRRHQILRLGAKLFRVLKVRLLDDTTLLSQLEESIAYNPNIFIEFFASPRTTHIGSDFLTLARNFKLTTSALNLEQTDMVPDAQLLLSERDVFHLIEQKLGGKQLIDDCRVVLDVVYKGAGQASFVGIIDACNTSSFRGTIVCVLDRETRVQTGLFNGFSITTTRGPLDIPAGPGADFSAVDGATALVIRK